MPNRPGSSDQDELRTIPSGRRPTVLLTIPSVLLYEPRIYLLTAVLGILSRFGKVGILPLDAAVFRTVRKLSGKGSLAGLPWSVALNRAFL
jgi:hypothetical protein